MQTLRYGRDELFPSHSSRDFRLFVLGATMVGVVFWAITKTTLADPLYLMTFMLTAVLALPSNAALAFRRGTRRGQSVLMWAAFTVMIASYGAVSIIVFKGEFRELPWILLCATGVVGGLAMTRWVARATEYRPSQAQTAGARVPRTVAIS